MPLFERVQGVSDRQYEHRSASGNIVSRGRGSYFRGMYQNNRANFDENLKHWCEICDRGFRAEFLLQSHVKEHQECKIDGCKFVAHPKVILKHVQMQHSTGLYKKIAKLSNPEEIAKWREERKRKYPTKSNIERKKLELEEKIKRGEKLGLAKNKQSKDFPDQSNKTRPNKAKKSRKRRKVDQSTEVKPQLVETEVNKGLLPFMGTHKTIESSDSELETDPVKDFDIEDEICESANNKIEQSQNNSMCSALMNLISTYESSDDENGNLQQQQHANIQGKKADEKIETKTNCSNVEINLDDDSGPEEVITQKLGPQPITCATEINKEEKKTPLNYENKKERFPKNIQKQRTYFRKTPSSLLEKLLHGEIRHERNVTLQCIRFIIDNNYFEDDKIKII